MRLLPTLLAFIATAPAQTVRVDTARPAGPRSPRKCTPNSGQFNDAAKPPSRLLQQTIVTSVPQAQTCLLWATALRGRSEAHVFLPPDKDYLTQA